jgi:hypothetical protein
MAIPRQLIVFAASAAVAGIVLYARNRMKEAEERTKAAKRRPTHPDGASSSSSTGEAPASAPSSTTADAGPALTGAVKELSLFLAGESWYDEVGWQGIWEREGVASPDGWLKSEGKNVLVGERKKLSEHPALLAGCRRRWIVVCRYAGIDVADAAALWNQTE